MNEKESNPYYKERKLKPLLRSGLSFGLSKEVKEDFDDYIERTYPNISFNQAMNHIILDLLNTRCLERKYFNIDVVGVFPIYQDYDNLEDFVICKHFASRDVYSINRNELSLNADMFMELKEYQYLNESKVISIEDLYKAYRMNYFTYNRLKASMIALDEFEFFFEELLEISNAHYTIVQFKVNNFLDDFIDGIYKSPSNRKCHMGIGYYSFEEEYRYFIYEWYFDNNMDFHIDHISLISEDDFKATIDKSTNEELKEEFENLNAPITEEQSLEERVKELSHLNDRLNEDILKITEMLIYTQHENETLKTQNQILDMMIKENEPKAQRFDRLVELVDKLDFSEVIDDDEESTQK